MAPFDISGNSFSNFRAKQYNSTNVVRSGLVLYLDAGNVDSYPGSGTTWYDLSGNGNNGNLYSVDWSISNGGIFQTNGSSSSYIDIPSPNLTTSDYTVIGAARYSGLGSNLRERMINAKVNNWLMGHWGNSVMNYYAMGWVTSVGAGGSDTLWRIYAATGRGTYGLYSNGSLNTSNTNGTEGPNGFTIGKIGYTTSEVSNGQVGFLLAYNRILSAQEILQNYQVFRPRYERYFDCGYGCQLYSYDPGCAHC
jgi:hypothetical protein